MRVLVAILITLLFPFSTYSAEKKSVKRTDFPYYAAITGNFKKGELYKAHLTADIIQKSRGGLNRFRLYDGTGRDVPYVIIENIFPGEPLKTYHLNVIDYSIKDNVTTITLEMPTGVTDSVAILELNIDGKDFHKNVKLYGSQDLKKMEPLTDDSVYDFTSAVDLRKTAITFKKSAYRYFILKLTEPEGGKQSDENLKLQYKGLDLMTNAVHNQQLKINSVTGLTTTDPKMRFVYDNKTFTDFELNTDGGNNSIIIVKAALSANRINFNISNPYYNRRVNIFSSETGDKDSYVVLSTGSAIYSFPLIAGGLTRDFIGLNSGHHIFYKFVIENGNNPPLEIKGINFQWVSKELFFVALDDTQKLFLRFGNPTVTMPQYDLTTFIRQDTWYDRKYEDVKIGDVKEADDYKPDIKDNYEKHILTIVIVLIALILGQRIYTLVKKAAVKY
ncbi:MAG: hypothetical protein H7844_14995 [Nitrospirae bacterium YQR-1]